MMLVKNLNSERVIVGGGGGLLALKASPVEELGH